MMRSINLGRVDIMIRALMGFIGLIIGWYVAFELDSAYGLFFGMMGVFLLFSAGARWCPIYHLIGLNSCPIAARKKSTVIRTRNLARWDMMIRSMMAIAFLVAGWYVAFELNSAYGLLFAMMGIFLFMTALAKWCPIYFIIGLSSCPLHDRENSVL